MKRKGLRLMQRLLLVVAVPLILMLAMAVENKHVSVLETLKRPKDAPKHNDPFDRILVAQAKAEGIMFLTHDSLISYYDEPFIISV